MLLKGTAGLWVAGASSVSLAKAIETKGDKNEVNGYSVTELINHIPKAESHVHIQGCVTPELLLRFSGRNKVDLPYQSEQQVRDFIANSYGPDLSDFVKVLDDISKVLKTKQDFYDTVLDYLQRSRKQNVRYVEAYFDPQPALENGISFADMMDGMNQARDYAAHELGIEAKWIMSFNRDRTPESAMQVLEMAHEHDDNIVGVGLDNLDTPKYPKRFAKVFERAREIGYKCTTHVDVGEDNATDRVWSSINDLKVDGRLDHGIDALTDPRFIDHLKTSGLTMAVCPTLFFNKTHEDSAYFRYVCDSVRYLLDNNLKVTLNTDDPGIFSENYLSDIFHLVDDYLQLSHQDVFTLARNSFNILWLDKAGIQPYLNEISEMERTYLSGSLQQTE